MRTDGHAATLDEAKAQFEAAWGQWLAWAKLQEIAAGAPAIGAHDSLEHPGGVCVFGGVLHSSEKWVTGGHRWFDEPRLLGSPFPSPVGLPPQQFAPEWPKGNTSARIASL